MPNLILVIETTEDQNTIGEFDSLEECYEKVVELDGPDPMNDPQLPENCEVVVYHKEHDRHYWLLEMDAWTQRVPGDDAHS